MKKKKQKETKRKTERGVRGERREIQKKIELGKEKGKMQVKEK